MRTTYLVRIHKHGHQNAAICKMIGKHNEGTEPLSISDFISYQSIHRALTDDKEKLFSIDRDDVQENIFYVSEDGLQSITLTVTEITIYNLKEAEENGLAKKT